MLSTKNKHSKKEIKSFRNKQNIKKIEINFVKKKTKNKDKCL